MKELMIREILDRYEKAINELSYYKRRVENHEQQLRVSNRENQQLKVNIQLLEAKLDELKNAEQ
jgi:cell shape-determining protein MreC